MSKKNEIKEEIGNLKFWLGVLVGIIVAIIGWVATSYKTADTPLLIASLVFCVDFIILAIWFQIKIVKKIRKLRDL